MKSFPRSKLAAALLLSAFALGACSSTPKKNPDGTPVARPVNPFKTNTARDFPVKPQASESDLQLEARTLYRAANDSLISSDFADALQRYDLIQQRYPFTEFATQADLEKVYALYRSYRPDEAITAARRFLREHPRHPRADYVQYLSGIVQSERDVGLADSLPLDTTKGDTTNLQKAFDEFSLLLRKYPLSRYNADARLRMLDLRNRIAEHEMHVVRYYLKRGAPLAAVKRAERVIAEFPGAPATIDALASLESGYQAIGLTDLATDAQTLYRLQNRSLINTPSPDTSTNAPASSAVGSKMTSSLNSQNDSFVKSSREREAEVQAPVEKPGFFSRVAAWFSFADRSESKPIVITLPSGDSTPAESAKEADGSAKKSNKLIVEIGNGGEETSSQPKK